jgi:hypothetical protein
MKFKWWQLLIISICLLFIITIIIQKFFIPSVGSYEITSSHYAFAWWYFSDKLAISFILGLWVMWILNKIGNEK